jgi:AcrR family transcriptional regulator
VASGRAGAGRTQEQRRAQTERRVLDAALALIERHGSHALTLAQVGSAAGYSRGIVHHHFGGRQQLLTAVVRDAQRLPPLRAEGVGLKRLEQLVGAYLRNVADRTSASRAFLRLWGEAVAGDPILMPLFAERDASFRTYLADLVAEGVADGSVRPDAEPKAAAVLLVGLLRGIGMQLIAVPAPGEAAEVTNAAVLSVHHAFAAAPMTVLSSVRPDARVASTSPRR